MQTLDSEYTFHNQWNHGFHIVEYNRTGRFRVNPFTFFQQGAKECFVYNSKLMAEKLQIAMTLVKQHILS